MQEAIHGRLIDVINNRRGYVLSARHIILQDLKASSATDSSIAVRQ
jgi:hypothetical protein